ncbi:alpha/beta-hydrolase [Calocera cornea HHB12733]|uniref:Alpha/beta-hydrolase n=1 Tax=Calocera cornea HHB12733 TaxID=1353952 RepID=A0A165K145_9BASI|nr:alpha/beta-hydrolase [Calocera cornea HHB12733]
MAKPESGAVTVDSGLPTPTATARAGDEVLPDPGVKKSLRRRRGTGPGVRRALLLSGAGLLLGWKLLSGGLRKARAKQAEGAAGHGSLIGWTSCADLPEFDCAYLSVPLSYADAEPEPSEQLHVSLALRRYPSTVPRNSADYMGTLFLNPGGPGESGTASVVHDAPVIGLVLGGRYDILSWDPRGVNMTTPALDCYPTEYDEFLAEQAAYRLGLPFQARGEGGRAAELALLKKTDAYYASGLGSCLKNGNTRMLASLSTAYNVRDMLRVLEALGEDGRGLQYWGFSYGSILGATFAAMFPEKVHRVMLDGVSSARLYTRDIFDWGRSGLDDTNKVWQGFLSSCAKAGPARCALAKGNDTAESIMARFDKIVENAIDRPVPVPWGGVTSGIVTASDVIQAVYKVLYAPKDWPKVATALAALEVGDAYPLAAYLDEVTPAPPGGRRSPLANIFNRHMTTIASPLTTEAIMCSDTDQRVAHAGAPDAAGFAQYVRELANISSITGESWALWVAKCRVWNVTATEAYRGPWTVAEGLKQTKFPVLFLGVTADPVTPLSAAKDMSAGFGNTSATLLIQDGFGHCSYAHPSLCTAKTVAAYFLEGKVPAYGTVCSSPEEYLFPESGATDDFLSALSMEDRELLQAWEKLGDR